MYSLKHGQPSLLSLLFAFEEHISHYALGSIRAYNDTGREAFATREREGRLIFIHCFNPGTETEVCTIRTSGFEEECPEVGIRGEHPVAARLLQDFFVP
jgi:hypothetical protein